MKEERVRLFFGAVFVTLLVGTGVPAQTPLVIPSHTSLALYPGSAQEHVLGTHAPCRVQVLYSKKALTGVPPHTVSAIALRAKKHGGSHVPHTSTITLGISMAGVPSMNQVNGRSYAANRGTDHVIYAKDKAVNFPAANWTSSPPPFAVVIPFDKPLAYRAGSNLCLEFEAGAPNNKPIQHDWLLDAHVWPPGGTRGNTVRFGRGCPHGMGFYGYAPPINGDSPLQLRWFTGLNAPAPFHVILGNSTTRWGVGQLPVDLTPFGAAGCHLYTNILASFTGTTTPSVKDHRVELDLKVPHLTALAYARLYLQALVLDPNYNPLGLRVSDGFDYRLGSVTFTAVPRSRTLYTYGVPAPIPDKPPYGGYRALVVQLR